MQGRQHGAEVPRLWAAWQAGRTPEAVDPADHAAQYASALAHALTSAGYPPDWLEVDIQEPSADRLEIEVQGDVPGLDDTSFASIARIAVSSSRVWPALPPGADVRLNATLAVPAPFPPGGPSPPPPSPEPAVSEPARPEPAPTPGPLGPRRAEAEGTRDALAPSDDHATSAADDSPALIPAGVQRAAEEMPTPAAAAEHGMILAMVGLVALAALVYLLTRPQVQGALPAVGVPARPAATATLAATVPAAATATAAVTPAPLTPVPTAGGLRTILDERFATPAGASAWLDDPSGPAWFGAGGYHLATREPGLFVAVAAPLGGPVEDVVVNATFVKNSGPDGGGYGVVVRDQATPPLDGQAQDGRFLLFEVGDQGEISIWQREGPRWLPVMPWRRSDAVRPGLAENDLKVIGHEDQVSFVVNGQQVAGLAYTGLPTRGGLGLFLGGDLNEVTVTHLSVQVP